VYLLSWILHDWDDERAQRVLHTCRDAGGESASLLVAEIVMPGRAGPRDAAALPTFDPFVVDLQMLLLTGGRERTEDEYRALFATARYELTTVHAVQSIRGVSIFEATPVS
ncbi:MAG TPA: methyltransferase, partial [Gemmatimonadaceae bacterium]|nr:methyltransferase [Gemmatimonadaceae bacterium]